MTVETTFIPPRERSEYKEHEQAVKDAIDSYFSCDTARYNKAAHPVGRNSSELYEDICIATYRFIEYIEHVCTYIKADVRQLPTLHEAIVDYSKLKESDPLAQKINALEALSRAAYLAKKKIDLLYSKA